MFIELHILQNFAPSNLNRDDTNQPKDTEFGGWRRARISSQSLKRAMRFDPAFGANTGVEPSKRTKWITRTLVERFKDKGKLEEESLVVATLFAEVYAGGLDKKHPGRTNVMLYLSPGDQRSVIETLWPLWENLLKIPGEIQATEQITDKKKREKAVEKAREPLADFAKELIKKTENRTTDAPDIALFGRMLTEHPETNVDAACQVAHAISTHAIRMDSDFFTVVDDLKKDDETGSGGLWTTGFNSACMYRYARLDFGKLVENLHGDKELALKTVKAFLLAAEAAIPSGKQNSFAAHNRPSFMLAVARAPKSAGWSLANAFESPVRPHNSAGLVAPSVKALDEYWQGLCAFYGESSVAAKAVAIETRLTGELSEGLQAAHQDSLEAWAEVMVEALAKAEAV